MFEKFTKDVEKAVEEAASEPLNENAAHDEANMIRASIGVSPETGRIPAAAKHAEEHKPTAEDYDNASKNLHKLEKLALTNAEAITIIDEVISMPVIGVGFLARLAKTLAGRPDHLGKRWQEGEVYTDKALEMLFGEAYGKISKLKAIAEQFGDKEGDSQTGAAEFSEDDRTLLRDLKIDPK